MSNRRRVTSLTLVMIAVSLLVGWITITLLYRAAFESQRVALAHTAQVQRQLIESIMQFDSIYSAQDHPDGAEGATLSQIANAYQNYEGFGETGEFVLARREGDQIVFLLDYRHGDSEIPVPVPLNSTLAQPMRLALSGQSGTVIAPDYRNVNVLAAYTPIAGSDWGLVAKIDMTEVYAPFIRAGVIAIGLAGVAILASVFLFSYISNPIVDSLEQSEARLQRAQQVSHIGTWDWNIITGNLYWTDEVFSLFGFNPGEFTPSYQAFLQIVHPDDRAYVEDQVRATIEEGKPYSIDHRIVLPDGQVRYVHEQGDVNYAANGTPASMIGLVIDITERHQLQQALKESEERLKNFIDSAVDTFALFDADMNFVEINRVGLNIMGLNKADVVGKHVLDISPGLKETGRYDAYLNVIQTGEPFFAEDIIPAPVDTPSLPAAVSIRAFKVGAGMGMILSNITERKRAEQELRESESKYRGLLEQAADGIFVNDMQGNFLEINTRACEMLGYTREELLHLTIPELVVGESGPPDFDIWAGDQIVTTESQLRHKDGRTIPVEISSRVFTDGRIQSIVRDITERKQAEQALRVAKEELEIRVIERTIELSEANQHLSEEIVIRRRAEEALQSERNFVSAVLNVAGALVVVLDHEGHIVRFNRACEETTGYTIEEMLGKHLWDMLLIPEEVEPVRQVFAKLAAGDFPNAYENYWVMRNGGRRLIAWENTALVDEDDRVAFVIGTGIDITEQRQMEQALQTAKNALEQRVESRTLELRVANEQLRSEMEEHKRTEQARQDAHQLLKAIFDHSHLMVAYMAPNFDFLMVNQAYAAADERSPEAYVGLNHFDLFPNADNQALFQKVIDSGEPYFSFARPFQYALNPERGVTYWDWTLVPVKNGGGVVTGLILTLQNVTERIQAMEALQASETRFRAVIDSLDEAVLVLDPIERHVVTYNPAVTDIFGYDESELDGQTTDILHTDESTHQQFEQTALTALDQGMSFHKECEMQRKDGREIYTDITVTQIADAAGNRSGIVYVIRDITERKRAEQELRESESKYRTLMEQAADGIFIADSSGSYVEVNSKACSMLGYKREELLQLSVADLVPVEEVADAPLRFNELLAGNTITSERHLKHKNGTVVPVEISAKMLADGRLQAITRDITERKQAEAKILASLREKEVMLKEIHHRVKNNLQIISSLLDLQSDYIQNEQVRLIFRESQNRVRTMALIHELLYQTEDLAQINFSEYVRSLTNFLFRSYLVNTNEIDLTVNADPELLMSVETAIPCGLIVNELVSNAMKHAFPNYQTGQIYIEVHATPNNQVTLSVSDDGVGFPEQLDFRRTRSLGLTLVNTLTRQIKGQIQMHQQSGTKFSISFHNNGSKG